MRDKIKETLEAFATRIEAARWGRRYPVEVCDADLLNLIGVIILKIEAMEKEIKWWEGIK